MECHIRWGTYLALFLYAANQLTHWLCEQSSGVKWMTLMSLEKNTRRYEWYTGRLPSNAFHTNNTCYISRLPSNAFTQNAILVDFPAIHFIQMTNHLQAHTLQDVANDDVEQEETGQHQLPICKLETTIYDDGMSAIRDSSTTRVFMVNSPGICGKVFLCFTILVAIRSVVNANLAIALTRLAANHLTRWKNSTQELEIPTLIYETSVCNIKVQSPCTELLHRTTLIVWDAVMATLWLVIECAL